MRTVANVERFRVEHDITDKRTLLGPYPEDNPFDQMDWEMIECNRAATSELSATASSSTKVPTERSATSAARSARFDSESP